MVTPVLIKTAYCRSMPSPLRHSSRKARSIPTQFPTLIAASTQVAKAAALFTALAPGVPAFTFWFRMRLRSGGSNPAPCRLPRSDPVPMPLSSRCCRRSNSRIARRREHRSYSTCSASGSSPAPPRGLADRDRRSDFAGCRCIQFITDRHHDHHAPRAGNRDSSDDQPGAREHCCQRDVHDHLYRAEFFHPGWLNRQRIVDRGRVVTLPGASALARSMRVLPMSQPSPLHWALPPLAGPAQETGTLADIAMLTSIASALDVVARYGISGATLSCLPQVARAGQRRRRDGRLQAQYPQSHGSPPFSRWKTSCGRRVATRWWHTCWGRDRLTRREPSSSPPTISSTTT